VRELPENFRVADPGRFLAEATAGIEAL
jgi:hypothetical protein